jgi:periplasmic copper chaperone A
MIRRILLATLAICALAAVLSSRHASAQTLAQSPALPATKPIKVGDLLIETTWLREPPDGARVAGGFMRITNSGKVADRLMGGSTTFAKRFEVHEMAVVDGVMRMRELTAGIEIKPGQTVELKPGGLHVMFMDLIERPKAGESRKTTLVFEKAGKVEIDMTVTPLGNRPPVKGHGHH